MTDARKGWLTRTTRVEPNSLVIAGYKLEELIVKSTLLETAHLLITTELPSAETLEHHRHLAISAALVPAPDFKRFKGEDISKTLAKALLMDEGLADLAQESIEERVDKTIYCFGRIARYLARIFDFENVLEQCTVDDSFASVIYRAVSGDAQPSPDRSAMVEAIVVASVDHGVTPPSAQAGIIAATVRSAYEMSLASGVGAITDVHGGAGAKAAEFFQRCAARSAETGVSLSRAAQDILQQYLDNRKRLQGMGHRVHTQDPRRDVLWQLAKSNNLAGPCVEVSELITDVFAAAKGKTLPINVDGVIGAIIADMGLAIDMAKALFIYGRVAGLSAHYFEEVSTQKPMRRVNFSDARYQGHGPRSLP
jgi:citrate synthase